MTSWDFLEFLELFFYWKTHGIGPWTDGLGPRARLMGLRTSHKTLAVQLTINGSDLKVEGVSSHSNPGHLPKDGRLYATPANGGSGMMRRAAAPFKLTRVRQIWRYGGLHLWGRCEVGTHLGWFLGGDGWLEGSTRRQPTCPNLRWHQRWVPRVL
jgi:hypothetical protein